MHAQLAHGCRASSTGRAGAWGSYERLAPALNSVIDLPEGINKAGHIGDDRKADNACAAFLRWRQPPDFVACYAGAG